MKSLIPLLVLVSAVSGAVDIQKRVLNGVDCLAHEGLHYVDLRDSESEQTFCGGNLISPEWVLTAAHCKTPTFVVGLGRHPSGDDVRMHFPRLKRKYVFRENLHHHDIMLFKLPKKLPEDIEPIKLPDRPCRSPDASPNDRYTLMGWSYTHIDAKGDYQNKAARLQCADVPLSSGCDGRYKELYLGKKHLIPKYLRGYLLCSYSPWQCQACPGDSGGSLVKDGVLYGVTVAINRTPPWMTFFIDVCAYREWIFKKTGI